MKSTHAFLLAVLMAASADSTLARGKSIYTLVLEVQSYTAASDGSYITTGVLTTPNGKFRCALSDQKHYLIAGPHRARKIGHDRLRVIVPIEKHKIERWTFKVIEAEKID